MKRGVLLAVVGSALLIGVAYASAFLPGGTPEWAPWLFVAGMSVMMVSTMALGAAREGSIGRLWIPFGLVLVILMGGFGLVLALPPADPLDPALWLGLPPRAAIVLYGIGFLPFLLVPVAYAATFHEQTLGPGDLERIRDEALAARGEMPLSPPVGSPDRRGRGGERP
ncbi:MAG: hypothetical protein EA422_04520 [Gemmatimonadales bacterium]|nr:MAG: hypothetical protein EA422_04520 [Gemmatimonadales bacterium]